MRSKKDMYINKKDYYKKTGKVTIKKWLIPMGILFLLAGSGLIYATQQKNAKEMNEVKQSPVPAEQSVQSTNELEAEPDKYEVITPSVTPEPVLSPTPVAAISPVPSSTPAITGMPEETAAALAGRPVKPSPVKVKGIYVTAGTVESSAMQKLIDMAEETEINAMVVDIKDDYGKITYQMDCKLAQEIGAVTNMITDLEGFVAKCKEKNIYLIARIVAFKDPYLAEQRPDLAVKNKDGTLYRDKNKEGWVNPYKQEIWDYLVEIASRAAAAGFDEIQFDYIRFSTGDGISNADFGKEADTISKEEVITEFTKYAYQRIKPLGVFVSADVFGAIINSSIDAGLVGQNYVDMAKNLDYICPMIYPSHFGEGNYGIQYPDLEPYEIISKVLEASKNKLSVIPEGEHKAIVRPWLQDFTATWIKKHQKYGADELREQIDGVYSVGYEEWLLWNSRCNYSEDGLLKE